MKPGFIVYGLVAGMVCGDLQEVLDEEVKEKGIPGMGAVVFDHREILVQVESGVREVGKRGEIGKDDPWHLGSDAKAMTATLMGRLVEKGLVKWESTLEEIFPKESKKFDDEAKKITVKQLLSHTAGLPGNVDRVLVIKGQAMGNRGIRKQRSVILETVAARKPEHAPGTKYLYSNTGYIIAGAVIEELLNTTWEKAIVEEVFEPLGIESAGFGAPEGSKSPRGHLVRDGKRTAAPTGYAGDNPAIYGPAGGLYLTLEDWVKFGQEHLMGSRGAGKLLKKETYAVLHEPVMNNYALGWGTAKDGSGKVVRLQHDGSNTMWLARIVLDLDKGRGICVVANERGPDTSDAMGRAVDEGKKLLK
ncbi:MAG: serine hydrolase domain-containing protein [Verrucomicrobiaceae bacterium]